MKKKFLLGIPCAAIAIASVIGVSQFDSENLAGNDLLMENVEALSASENNPDQGSMWFARMNEVECSVVTIVPVGGAHYNGKWFAGGAKITLSGHKWRCERDWVVNTCNYGDETSCSL